MEEKKCLFLLLVLVLLLAVSCEGMAKPDESDEEINTEVSHHFEEPDAYFIDPCDPNPCTEPNQNQCELITSDYYICDCNPDFQEDSEGHCIPVSIFQGDRCEDPVEISSEEPHIRFSELVSRMNGDFEATCGGSGPDSVFLISVEETSFIEIVGTGDEPVLYLRSTCDSVESEMDCGSGLSSASLSAFVEPGEFYLFVDSNSEVLENRIEVQINLRGDPCGNVECNGTSVCEPNDDWSNYRCFCPPGNIWFEGTCISWDDPCEPDPCDPLISAGCRSLSPYMFQCRCRPGYINGEDGLCIADDTCGGECTEFQECTESLSGIFICTELADFCRGECTETQECVETSQGVFACVFIVGPENNSGNTCGTAISLSLDDFPLTRRVALDELSNEYRGSCAGSGQDGVFAIEVLEPVFFEVTATGPDTVLYMRTGCENSASELTCNDDHSPPGGYGSYIEAEVSEPGTVYLFMDSYSDVYSSATLEIETRTDPCSDHDCNEDQACLQNSGWTGYECVCPDGTLEFEDFCVDDPCSGNPCSTELGRTLCERDLPDQFICLCEAPYYREGANGGCEAVEEYTGDICSAAEILSVDDMPISRRVGLSSLRDDYQGSCAGFGEDAVFAIDVIEPAFFEVTATGPDTVLYMRTDCRDSDSELICNDDHSPPGDFGSYIAVEVNEPGTVYLFVDSYSSTYQDAFVNIVLREDPCNEHTCNDDQVCLQNTSWTGYECVCPEGTLEFGAECLDDPCEPDPCREQELDYCIAELPEGHRCGCVPGFIEEQGACIPDPDGAAWTIMVFMNADNNLEESAFEDIAEMEIIGSIPSSVNILVELDTYSDSGKRLYIEQGNSVVLEELGEINMGDWRQLADFGEWAVTNYPAQRYALIMWNHGGGWKSSVPRKMMWKGFSNDESHYGSEISVSDGSYGNALQQIVTAAGRPMDIVGFDACLMGTWEVAHASAPYADYMVASEDSEPFLGWAFDGFLGPLIDNPLMEPVELSEYIITTYHNTDETCTTLSLIDLGTMDELGSALSRLADLLQGHSELDAEILSAAHQSVSFIEDMIDLKGFAEIMAQEDLPGPVLAALNELILQLESTILFNRSWYEDALGLTIYLPGSNYDSDYNNGTWSADTTWDDFLQVTVSR